MNPREVLTRQAPLPDAVVRYADHTDGVIDLYLPPGDGPHPLVVLAHGGFWRDEYDRRHTRPLSDAMKAEGYCVAVPEYRRTGGGGGGWPTTFDDIDAAVAAIPDLVAGLGVATTGTTYLGHSAGGHLVLWLADQPHKVDRVVALAPVGDLRAGFIEGLDGDAVEALLGGSPEAVPERYDAADPAARLSAATPCEIVVLHGSLDEQVPLANSAGLAARHPEVDLRVLDGVEHFGLVDPFSPAWPALLAALAGNAD